LYPDIGEHIKVILEEGVEIVFTSAGNPKTWTSILKERGLKVIHVVANTKFALKAQDAGADAIVAEGFEAGGHNGREETTTFCLIPQILQVSKIPVIAAGGIATGSGILAAMALGADGVQIGSLFAASQESSAHINFKNAIVSALEGDTQLTLKQLTPVRLIKNKFFRDIEKAEERGATPEELIQLLGKARAKKGMFEGDIEEGELEIGQVSAILKEIKPAAVLISELISAYKLAKSDLCEKEFGI
jgi:enoyl-[acyl-carrier protein] reductase II